MENLIVFDNEQFGNIRTTEIDGEPWFVGKDIATALGYSNTRDAILKHVDAEDKRVSRFATPSGEQEMTVINESGMIALTLSSKLPSAKAFKHWITKEVVPSIRKTGGYIAGQESMSDSELMAKALLVAQKQIEERQKRIDNLTQKVELDAPKVLFADAVATAKTSILVGELAKILRQNGIEIGQNRLFKWLRKNGYLISRMGTDYNMPTQYSMERGWMEIKEHAIMRHDGATIVTKTTVITGKGQQYFINLFLKGGNANG